MVDRSKRVSVSLSEEYYPCLEDWALQQGRTTANLASHLIEQSIRHAISSGEYSPASSVDFYLSAINKLPTSQIQQIKDKLP